MRLSKEKGVNPKLTFCRRCGGDTEELMLIGANEGKFTCSQCGMVSFGSQPMGYCPNCKQNHLMTRTGTIGEYEKLPASEPCDKCKKEITKHESIVAKGGVYWKCTKCGSEGVIKGTTELAKEVRKRHKIKKPAPCGIDFEGTYLCPVCHPEK